MSLPRTKFHNSEANRGFLVNCKILQNKPNPLEDCPGSNTQHTQAYTILQNTHGQCSSCEGFSKPHTRLSTMIQTKALFLSQFCNNLVPSHTPCFSLEDLRRVLTGSGITVTVSRPPFFTMSRIESPFSVTLVSLENAGLTFSKHILRWPCSCGACVRRERECV